MRTIKSLGGVANSPPHAVLNTINIGRSHRSRFDLVFMFQSRRGRPPRSPRLNNAHCSRPPLSGGVFRLICFYQHLSLPREYRISYWKPTRLGHQAPHSMSVSTALTRHLLRTIETPPSGEIAAVYHPPSPTRPSRLTWFNGVAYIQRPHSSQQRSERDGSTAVQPSEKKRR